MCCTYGYIVTMHIGYKTDGIPWRDGLYKHKRHPNFWLDHSLFSFYFVRQKRENPKLISCDFCVRKSEERLLAYTVLHSFKVLFVWIPVEDEAKCGVSLIRVWNVCCCENRFVRPVGRSIRRIGWKTGLESDKQGVNRTRLWSTRIKRNPKVQSYELFFDLIVIHGSFFWVSNSILFRFCFSAALWTVETQQWYQSQVNSD